MTAKLPWVQFYYRDWIMDTQFLNHLEKSCWFDLLCQMWLRGIAEIDIDFDALREIWHFQEEDEAKEIITTLSRKGICEAQFFHIEDPERKADVRIRSRRLAKEELERINNAKYQQNHRSKTKVSQMSGKSKPVDVRDQMLDVRDQMLDVRDQKQTPTPLSEPPNAAASDLPAPAGSLFEKIWTLYPKRDGKKAAERHFRVSVKNMLNWLDIQKALRNYLRSENVKKGFVKNGSTWFNNWQDWTNYTEESNAYNGGKSVLHDSAFAQRAREVQGLRKVGDGEFLGKVLNTVRGDSVHADATKEPRGHGHLEDGQSVDGV